MVKAIAPAEVPSDLCRGVPVPKRKAEVKSAGGDKSSHLLPLKVSFVSFNVKL